MNLQQYYTDKTNELSAYTENAGFDIKRLICHTLEMSENAFFMNMHSILTDEQTERLNAVIQRRINGEPLQYILGKWGFMGREFYVNPDCLIPRQDTETLVESALKEILRRNYSEVLDICTGSGCIAIALAAGCGARVTGTDISEKALAVAAKNAELNNVSLELKKSDLFEAIQGSYDMITANPPYLTRKEMENLQRELAYEPSDALYGGEDGLDFYRRIAQTYKPHLKQGGMMLLEVGEAQADAVREMFDNTDIITDICGKKRVIAVFI